MNIIKKMFKKKSNHYQLGYNELLQELKRLSYLGEFDKMSSLVKEQIEISEEKEKEYQERMKPYHDSANVLINKIKKYLDKEFGNSCRLTGYSGRNGGGCYTVSSHSVNNNESIQITLTYDHDEFLKLYKKTNPERE